METNIATLNVIVKVFLLSLSLPLSSKKAAYLTASQCGIKVKSTHSQRLFQHLKRARHDNNAVFILCGTDILQLQLRDFKQAFKYTNPDFSKFRHIKSRLNRTMVRFPLRCGLYV